MQTITFENKHLKKNAMLLLSELTAVINNQREKITFVKSHPRQLLSLLQITNNFALIISGIRRCGKSTLLSQMINKDEGEWLYLNFDTPRLYSFNFEDLRLLDKIIIEQNVKTLYFDEIQVVDKWEIYIRGKLDEGYNVVVTGSNASMLSRELGTKLTGRHITKELFPFSYNEYCDYNNLNRNKESLQTYLQLGGMPQYLETNNSEILQSLINDIIYRDIAVRHNIRDERSLRQLLMFLIANIGNLVSANNLKSIVNIKSTNTILEYLSFLEASYLIQLVPRFSYSYRVQQVNPRKVYFIDNGIQSAISPSFTSDWGRKLENMVFWEIRRLGYDIYYFNEQNSECDFVIFKNKELFALIQVCLGLDSNNLHREINGVKSAMEFFKIDKAYILTLDQRDMIITNKKTIEVLPVYEMDTVIY